MTSERVSRPGPPRRAPGRRRLPAGALASFVALLLLAPAGAAERAAEPGAAAPATLLGIEAVPGMDEVTLVCRGTFRHRIEQSDDGLQVLVELQGVRNAVPADALPEPGGALNGISIGGGTDGDGVTRVIFALTRPARAVAEVFGDGLVVRFAPAAAADGGGPAEQRSAPAPARGSASDAAPPPAPPPRGRTTGALESPADRIRQAPALPATPPGHAPAATPAAPEGSGERPVGSEDLLEISVFEIPELNRTVRVSERGTISLPLLGEVPSGGLTPRQIEAALRARLGEKYVRDPQVSVFVREHGSKKVSVLGAVGKPGVYEMLGQRTLLQVLAQAGGLTQDVGARLHVIRQKPGGEAEKISVDVNDLLVSRNPALNLAIEPGDIVSAPIDRPVYVYVDGAVKTPGRVEQLASRPLTLLQVIARAGGTTERANLKAAQILRQSADGTQTILEVNLKRIRRGKEPDPVLGEGDVVVVPETFF